MLTARNAFVSPPCLRSDHKAGCNSADVIIWMHPTDEEMRTYCLGEPSPELVERIEEHLDTCGECARVVACLVRDSMRNLKDIADTPQ
jgi:hypothetical protein